MMINNRHFNVSQASGNEYCVMQKGNQCNSNTWEQVWLWCYQLPEWLWLVFRHHDHQQAVNVSQARGNEFCIMQKGNWQ